MLAIPISVWAAQVWLALRTRGRTLGKHWPLVLLCALAATLYSSTLSRDSSLYFEAYNTFSGSGWQDIAIESTQIEPLFLVLAKLTHAIGLGYLALFFAYALASSAAKIWLILKLSRGPRISLLFYFSYFFLLHDSTQIRASLAIAVLFWAAWDLVEERPLQFVVKVLAAGLLLHVTSLAFLLVYFFRSRHARPLLLTALVASLALYFSGLASISLLDRLQDVLGTGGTIIALKLENYSATLDDYTVVGPFVPLALVSYLLGAALYACRKRFSEFEALCFNCLLFSFSLFVILSAFPVAQFRLSELFSYGIVFLVPVLLDRTTLRRPSELVAACTTYGGLCLVAFCYFAYYKGMV